MEKSIEIYYMRDDKGRVCGVQVYEQAKYREWHYELHTNYECCGLWVGSKQVIGTLDFDLNCSDATARKRLREQVAFRSEGGFDIPGFVENLRIMKTSKKPLW